MIHELKCWPEFFDAIEDGDKTFEVRVNDRGFQKGDVLLLKRWDSGACCATARRNGTYTLMRLRVTYVLPIDGGKVVMAIRTEKEPLP